MTDTERTDHRTEDGGRTHRVTTDGGEQPSDADAGRDAPGTDGSEERNEADGDFDPDPERVATLREIADDVRGETGESKQLANVLYRTSDLYDPDEDVTPEEVVRNVKFILEVKERGGLDR